MSLKDLQLFGATLEVDAVHAVVVTVLQASGPVILRYSRYKAIALFGLR